MMDVCGQAEDDVKCLSVRNCQSHRDELNWEWGASLWFESLSDILIKNGQKIDGLLIT